MRSQSNCKSAAILVEGIKKEYKLIETMNAEKIIIKFRIAEYAELKVMVSEQKYHFHNDAK